MAYYRDLREYISAVDSTGGLLRFKRSIDKDSELAPLVRLQYRGLPRDKRRACYFENVTDGAGRRCNGTVAIGVLAGTLDIFALGLKCQSGEISDVFRRAAADPIAPRLVAHGVAQEEVHMGASLLEHGGLGEFPIPVASPGFDPSPYITAPCFISKDPESGIPNAGMYRAMVKAPDRLGINFGRTTQGGYIHWDKYRKLGKPLPAAIAIGGPPSFSYTAASTFPRDYSEFGAAGAIAGEPLDLVKCKTVDLEVPATAEVVIEGYLPTDSEEPEAPFGEVNSFIAPMEMKPYMVVTAITHRRNPVWLATQGQFPPSEDLLLEGMPFWSNVYNNLRHVQGFESVLEVGTMEDTGSNLIIRVDEKGAGRAWEILEAANKIAAPRLIIAVSREIDVWDCRSVIQAVAARTQPYRDYRTVTFHRKNFNDFSLGPIDQITQPGFGGPEGPTMSTLLINATLKWPMPPTALPARQYMEKAMRIWREEGLPDLHMAAPWFGTDLGYWNDEHSRHARAAAEGNPYQAGSDYEKLRRRIGN
jgi:4-hydroxy-3-polyprenylbenzoate decarboxylase